MGETPLPPWRLPPGVTRGLWEYTHDDSIADDYDEYFAYNSLFAYDEAVLVEWFSTPGVLVDLGCGTGRLSLALARRGFQAIAVDLSLPMLRVVGRKAAEAGIPVDRLQANVVELGCLADASVDYAILMFSTLGMIRGAANRRAVLDEVRRIVRPGGQFAIHVHNRWYHLFDPQGRWWLLREGLWPRRREGLEPGDRVFDYRGVRNMFLHTFTLGELKRLVRAAGFQLERLIPLNTSRQRPLAHAWWFGRWRANGWIACCR